MAAPNAPVRAHQPGTRLAWRPLQRSTRVAIIGALLATLFYQLFLINPAYRGPTWLWITMLLAEGLTALHLIGTWWTILAHDDRPEPVDVTVWRNRLRTGAEAPSIDVFITAYGEDPALVRRTMVAARNMVLPHETYVLDDGDSDELQRLAAEVGVHYLRREGGRHAKAGNVNAALARTTGEFVVIFDADHVPEPGFLLEVLPITVRRALPVSMISCATRFAWLIGIAKARPMLPASSLSVASDRITEFTPITLPVASISGPPELPWLTAASVWMAA